MLVEVLRLLYESKLGYKGWEINPKRVLRVWRSEGLEVTRKNQAELS